MLAFLLPSEQEQRQPVPTNQWMRSCSVLSWQRFLSKFSVGNQFIIQHHCIDESDHYLISLKTVMFFEILSLAEGLLSGH